MFRKFRKTKFVAKILSIIRPLIGKSFHGSEDYWKTRYAVGKNSGSGSYGRLAEFKAEVLNAFVKNYAIQRVIEFGMGDGNQLRLASYPEYIGFDVSPVAVDMCKKAFSADTSKSFHLLQEYANNRADLTLSLDVLYHLVEDSVFHGYLERLFDSSDRFVVIYAADSQDRFISDSPHVRLREFTPWVKVYRPDWKLKEVVPNRFPFDPKDTRNTSFADFYIYEKVSPDVASSSPEKQR